MGRTQDGCLPGIPGALASLAVQGDQPSHVLLSACPVGPIRTLPCPSCCTLQAESR